MIIPPLIARIVARSKIYIGRAFGYVGIMNSVLIFSIFLSSLEQKFGWTISGWTYIILYATLIAGVIFVGYIDAEWGIFEAENEIVAGKTKQIRELHAYHKTRNPPT